MWRRFRPIVARGRELAALGRDAPQIDSEFAENGVRRIAQGNRTEAGPHLARAALRQRLPKRAQRYYGAKQSDREPPGKVIVTASRDRDFGTVRAASAPRPAARSSASTTDAISKPANA